MRIAAFAVVFAVLLGGAGWGVWRWLYPPSPCAMSQREERLALEGTPPLPAREAFSPDTGGGEDAEVLGMVFTDRLIKTPGTPGDDRILGTNGTETLEGEGGNDTLIAGPGRDFVYGSQGNDTLYGGPGADSMAGDEGDDLIYAGPGNDRVNEHDGDDVIYGGPGDDEIRDGFGNDLIHAGSGNDKIKDYLGINTLCGGEGDDHLEGGVATSWLEGGPGDDVYGVSEATITLVEALSEGNDTVITFASYPLPENVENLILTDVYSVNAIGNALDNSLSGNAGDNVIDGGPGDDTMKGGGGSDVYIIDSPRDRVFETDAPGTDTVRTPFSHVLGPHFENLVLTGESAAEAMGNSSDNVITGNSADNLFSGGRGNDTLTGSGGRDTFVFGHGFGIDRIKDFSAGASGDDVIQLDLGTAFDSFAEVRAAAVQDGNDTLITLGGAGRIALENVQLDSLDPRNFVFTP
jgi:Ca2+-binding RTX toxin-like protein